MKVNRTVSLAVVILMVMALVLAACGQDSTPEVALDYDTRGAVRERIAIDTAEDSYIYNGGDIKFYSDNHSTGTITLDGSAGTLDLTGALADSGGTFTFEDNVIVDGQADAVQLTVQGYSTQTSNTFVVETSAGTDLFWVTNNGDVEMNGTTPVLTIGDAGEEDAAVVWDGAAQDFYIGLDDTADDLVFGKGSALGTTQAFGIDENLLVTFSGAVQADSTLTANGAAALDGGITVDTSNFTVNGSTGAVATASTLAVGGLVSDSNGPFGINDNTSITGTLSLSGNATLGAGSSIYPSASITGTSAVFSCLGTVAYTDTTAKGICIIPANANVIDWMSIVTVAFNDSGTDKIACGITYADPDDFLDDLDGEAVGLLRAGSGATLPYAGAGDIGSAAKTVWCKFTGQNSNASAGALTFILYYHVD